MTADFSVPSDLVREIRGGNCVAFVGAGFSKAAGLKAWRELLHALGSDDAVKGDLRDEILRLIGPLDGPVPTAHDLDQAAQMLADLIDAPRFTRRLRDELPVKDGLPAPMRDRLELLRSIPFRAVLTTNFDGVIPRGETPTPRGYRSILRNERAHWWQKRFWDRLHAGAPVMALHGDLRASSGNEEIVFTREQYRKRLYGDPAYMTFLRSIFATSTVLYMGFSFTDAYLNELRSEILALLGSSHGDRPIAYAIFNDVSPATSRYLLRHEGIHVLDYDTKAHTDFSGFDGWLRVIRDATSAQSQLGALLGGRKILWMDPEPDNNAYGIEFLKSAAKQGNALFEKPTMLEDPDSALAALIEAQESGRPFDLTISRWGPEPPDAPGLGARLLQGMRAADVRCPVLIFAGQHDADRRKREALALGALAYCTEFETLFRRIEEIFAPASTTW